LKKLLLRSFSLAALHIEDGPRPASTDDAALVRVKAAGLNPSDLMNIKGAFHYTSLPRVPGRDYAGVVEEGPDEWIGRSVWGSGAELGFSQDGTYSEFVAVPSSSLVEKPANVSFAAAAAAGVPFATAYQAIVQAAKIQAGETAFITGAVGAVGSAACQIALQKGARVIGLVKQPTEVEGIEFIQSDEDVVARIRELTAGRGVDVCLDAVSGLVFPTVIASLANGGRLAVIIAKGDGKVTLDLRDLYRRKLQLLGVNSLLVDTRQTAEIYRKLNPLVESGKLRCSEPQQISFAEVHSAFESMEKGSAPKVVLVP
jgi:NADPH2:quinone reductase